MDVRAEDIEGIPTENLRVPRAAFVHLWQATRRMLDLGSQDSYVLGIAITCRWVAFGTATLNGRSAPASSPITRTRRPAHEELLERELQAAETAAIRLRDSPGRDQRLPVEGAAATLRWAWKGLGDPPLDLRPAAGVTCMGR